MNVKYEFLENNRFIFKYLHNYYYICNYIKYVFENKKSLLFPIFSEVFWFG